jgi:hypothetical protein
MVSTRLRGHRRLSWMLAGLAVPMIWLAQPDIALAHDCYSLDEIRECIRTYWDAFLGAIAAAAAFAATAAHEAAKLAAGDRLLPPVVSEVAPLASEEGANMERDAMNAAKYRSDMDALADAPDESMGDRRQQQRDQSLGDFFRGVTGGGGGGGSGSEGE